MFLRAIAFTLLACAPPGALAQLAPDATPPPQSRAAPAPKAAPLPITPPEVDGAPPILGYPTDRLDEGITTRVLVQLDVGADGAVSNTSVVTPPQPGFDEAALAAAQKLHFHPAKQGDDAIAVRIQFAFNFAPPAA